MSFSQPHLSITLPRNFTFHYTDGQLPHTPEPVERENTLPEPPERPHQTYRIRRRRRVAAPDGPSAIYSLSHTTQPPPSIEIGRAPALPLVSTQHHADTVMSTGRLVTPLQRFSHLSSAPKTPTLQTSTISDDDVLKTPAPWRSKSAEGDEELSRPLSVCSMISDSSVQSSGSAESYPSLGGSCTSPDSDAADTFTYPIEYKAATAMSPFSSQKQDQRPNKRARVRQKQKWTAEMDQHLWINYILYLQDPTLTPFKVLPGSAPPLGVCSRVAREAKKTWKPTKGTSSGLAKETTHTNNSRKHSNTTEALTLNHDANPSAYNDRKTSSTWPRSESATRRRLRELCKRKPSFSAHYQRLMQSRTPSPFPAAPQSIAKIRYGRLSSPMDGTNETSALSTRGMMLSLATSTSNTMQHGNPLSLLAREESNAAKPEQDWRHQVASRAPAHQKSQSLQVGLGLGAHASISFPLDLDLTSPGRTPTLVVSNSSATLPARSIPTLAPPLEIHAPIPLPRSFKRRAHCQPEDELGTIPQGGRRNLLHELFGAPADISHRRVRSRGFSFGDMGEGARRLSSIFIPPAKEEIFASGTESNVTVQEDLSPALYDDITRRLGSPFMERPSGAGNTFPRTFSPNAIGVFSSFEETLQSKVSETNQY